MKLPNKASNAIIYSDNSNKCGMGFWDKISGFVGRHISLPNYSEAGPRNNLVLEITSLLN